MQELIMSLIRSEKLSEQDLIELQKVAAGESGKKTQLTKKAAKKNKRSKS